MSTDYYCDRCHDLHIPEEGDCCPRQHELDHGSTPEASSAPTETGWSLALSRLVTAEIEGDAEFKRCWDEVAGMFRSLTATVGSLTDDYEAKLAGLRLAVDALMRERDKLLVKLSCQRD